MTFFLLKNLTLKRFYSGMEICVCKLILYWSNRTKLTFGKTAVFKRVWGIFSPCSMRCNRQSFVASFGISDQQFACVTVGSDCGIMKKNSWATGTIQREVE